MKLVWNCKPDVKRTFEPLIKKHAHLIPSWCHVLHCDFATESEDGVIASITPLVEYRKAYLYIHSVYLGCDEEERERAVVHELLHLQIAPVANVAAQLIRSIVTPESALAEWAWEEQRRAVEGAVEDLRLAFESSPTPVARKP